MDLGGRHDVADPLPAGHVGGLGAFYGGADTSRAAQVAWGIVLGSAGVAGVVALARWDLGAPRVGPLARWARWAWIVPLVSMGLATPFVFLVGAIQARFRWLWVATAASFDLCVLWVVTGAGDTVPPGLSAVMVIAAIASWIGAAVVILAVWLKARRVEVVEPRPWNTRVSAESAGRPRVCPRCARGWD